MNTLVLILILTNTLTIATYRRWWMRRITKDEVYNFYRVHGKPKATDMSVEFNFSHSGDMVVCCADNVPVGVDVEMMRPIGTNILRKVCTRNDLCYFLDHDLEGNIELPYEFNKP